MLTSETSVSHLAVYPFVYLPYYFRIFRHTRRVRSCCLCVCFPVVATQPAVCVLQFFRFHAVRVVSEGKYAVHPKTS